jgi:hypothetical protein
MTSGKAGGLKTRTAQSGFNPLRGNFKTNLVYQVFYLLPLDVLYNFLSSLHPSLLLKHDILSPKNFAL